LTNKTKKIKIRKEKKKIETSNQERKIIVAEPTTVSYNYGQKKINQYHDKTFKTLFSNKEEAAKFINKHLKLEGTPNELTKDKIEKCNTEFITKKKRRLACDVLYKIQEKNIFILIEQQSKVDNLMPKRFLEYCVEIMQEVEKQTPLKEGEKVPIVYPILFYTGKRKWTAKTELIAIQEEIEGINKALNLSYYLVDINDYSKEELLKERSSISKAMLMEKINNKEELLEILEKITKENLSKEEKNFMLDILMNIVTEEIGSKKAEELKEKIEKEEEDTMVMENLRNIFRMNYNEGVQSGIQTGIQTGIQKGIKKITKVDDNELQEIKKEIEAI